ncbi:hypothetical protein A4D02_04670 [Niastella koreensis]|uniref:Uncharacterized protein n=2 Tax=Niastella koreensis TaxID=354356 RepID=G8TRX9_NIAKG|nr:hypothetical protein [Niastella koreensis]AEW03314.1 hypothetical protein Niako_7093 [Niastella koreensis GR20-10]OQP55601.1 hypothetical protein A4D02_04670 [Niastella koreensis]
MMNAIWKFLKDVSNIFSTVPETGKLIIRAIAAKGALKLSYAQSEKISTNQFGGRAAIVRRGDRISTTVLHDSRQII